MDADRVEKVAESLASHPPEVISRWFQLTVDLDAGRASAERITSDLPVDYVRFNSAYRT
jgi:N-acetylglutamate synthase/N-acetylornithine aminotransferase